MKTPVYESAKTFFMKWIRFVRIKSLRKAAESQQLNELALKLEQIVPDITNQYSTFEINTDYFRLKVRNLHAFQVYLVNQIIDLFEKAVIVDIGDSFGTHLQYILGIHSKNKEIKCLSVNLDTEAVERIRQKGLEARKTRAEDLVDQEIDADIFLCFEMLEHLMDPCHFLHQLSSKTNAQYLIVTVPYVRKSQVGLHHIREGRKDSINAENTHIFELNPEDWKLLVRHSGWNIVTEEIYLQYPKRGFLRITKAFWRKFDFEGFYGLILKRDDTWSSRYRDW